MDEAPIVTRGLRKSFGEHVVLDGIELSISAGSIHGLIGPNGAGKTTTVRILLGLIPDFEGEVRVAGFDPRADPLEVKRRIGYVPENAVLYDAMTVAELLLLIGRLHGMPDQLIQSRGDIFLEALELSDRLNARIATLSKGMRQKVLLTAAVLHDPEILFVDEPLSGLDVNASILLKEFFRRFADRGKAVLYCSHVMDVVERICDRIDILHGGRIVAGGSFAELSERASEHSLERIFGQLTSEGREVEKAERMLDAFA